MSITRSRSSRVASHVIIASANGGSTKDNGGTSVHEREVRVWGICFETHPAGASQCYSGRYKPATKSSVCDTLIIGRIYGVYIVLPLTDTQDTGARFCRSVYAARMCRCYIALVDIRRKCTFVCVRTYDACIHVHMPARSCTHARFENAPVQREDDCWKIIEISGAA